MTQAPATPELADLLAENEALTKALTGLTCGGSEFFIRKGDRYVADIDACVSWVRRAKEDAHRRTVKAITEQKASQKALRAVERLARSGDHEHTRLLDIRDLVIEALSSQGRREGEQDSSSRSQPCADAQERSPGSLHSGGIDDDCPHAGTFRYCAECPVSPCPLGLGRGDNQ